MIVDEMESAMRESIVGNWGVGLLVTLAGFWVVLVFLGLRLTRFRWRVAAALALIVSSSMYLGLHPEWHVDGGWLGKLARDGLAVPMASSMVLPAIKVVLFVVSALALLVATDWLPLKLFVSQAGTLELDDPGDARRTGARVRAGGPVSRGSGEQAAVRSRARAERPAPRPE